MSWQHTYICGRDKKFQFVARGIKISLDNVTFINKMFILRLSDKIAVLMITIQDVKAAHGVNWVVLYSNINLPFCAKEMWPKLEVIEKMPTILQILKRLD